MIGARFWVFPPGAPRTRRSSKSLPAARRSQTGVWKRVETTGETSLAASNRLTGGYAQVMPGAGVKFHFPGKSGRGQRPRLEERLTRVTFRKFRLFRSRVQGGEKVGKEPRLD